MSLIIQLSSILHSSTQSSLAGLAQCTDNVRENHFQADTPTANQCDTRLNQRSNIQQQHKIVHRVQEEPIVAALRAEFRKSSRPSEPSHTPTPKFFTVKHTVDNCSALSPAGAATSVSSFKPGGLKLTQRMIRSHAAVPEQTYNWWHSELTCTAARTGMNSILQPKKYNPSRHQQH